MGNESHRRNPAVNQIPMNDTHAKMLRYIRRRADQGQPASAADIMRHCGIKGEGTVWAYLTDLAESGLIEYRTPRPDATAALEA